MQPAPLGLLSAVAVATSSPTPSVRHGVSLPSTGDDACVSLVRQDLKLLVSYRTKRNFPSLPAKNFPCSSATLTLIWFTVKWSFGRAHGIFVLHRVTGLELLLF